MFATANRPSTSSRLARLFVNGRSQAVRLPREFRFSGTQVRVSRHGRGVLIEPVISDVDAWFAELDRYAQEPFMSDGRRQPPTTERAGLP
jgi:antitoxin VapB